jgi:hypothetical protein
MGCVFLRHHGLPKPIVHSQGGIVVEHVKMAALHLDLGPEDRFHWYSSSGWIMWNCQMAGLLLGSTACIYDGNPGWPDWNALWRFVGETGVTFFGAGAAFFLSCLKARVEPNQVADLSRLRAVGSTGSPLPPEGYQWIYDHVRRDIWLNPISGGTDFAGCFVGGVPTLPVYLGEMQCRCLGAKVEAFDDAGKPLIDEVGELVCSAPMPSMPLMFWNDPEDRRYRESYFDMYPGIWRHGDWLRITPRGGAIIYGRSDATINRHGIRMGTSELYRAVEELPEVLDSLVVDLEFLGRESYMPLFVVLRPGHELTPQLEATLRERIKVALSARHVPNEIFQVAEIPRTLSGKKMELPVKKLLLGHAIDKVANPDAMANPGSLQWFVDFAARRAGRHGRARHDAARRRTPAQGLPAAQPRPDGAGFQRPCRAAQRDGGGLVDAAGFRSAQGRGGDRQGDADARAGRGLGRVRAQRAVAEQAALTLAVGTQSGRKIDKFLKVGAHGTAASVVGAPLIDGCLAWLECRVIPNRTSSRPTTCSSAKWSRPGPIRRRFPTAAGTFPMRERRSIHYLAGGSFFATGDAFEV